MWRRASILGVVLVGLVAGPVRPSWDNPVQNEWPDVVGDQYNGQPVVGMTAAQLLDEIQAVALTKGAVEADYGTVAATDWTNVWGHAGERKTHPFVREIGPEEYEAHTPKQGWARVLVALRYAEMGDPVKAAEKLSQPEGWPMQDNWADLATATPGGSARHYIHSIELYINAPNGPNGSMRRAIDFLLNDNPPLEPRGWKWRDDHPAANPARWARLVCANFYAQTGDWDDCKNELEDPE